MLKVHLDSWSSQIRFAGCRGGKTDSKNSGKLIVWLGACNDPDLLAVWCFEVSSTVQRITQFFQFLFLNHDLVNCGLAVLQLNLQNYFIHVARGRQRKQLEAIQLESTERFFNSYISWNEVMRGS